MEHHNWDTHPIPNNSMPTFVNEPWLIDQTLREQERSREPDSEPDNIRIYLPLDLNKNAVLRRLDWVIAQYGEATEANEMSFEADVSAILSQVEIYDQIWSSRKNSENRRHSAKAIDLIQAFVARLKEIPDGCAECFPFEMIDFLEEEYLLPGNECP